MTVIYSKMAIIGIGLIGSSVALAARRAGLVGHIVGCDRDPEVVSEVIRLGLADSVTADAAEAVADADLVVMAAGIRPETRLATDAGIESGTRENVRIATHDNQQVAEIMGDATGQLPQGVHLLRLPQLMFEIGLVRDVHVHHECALCMIAIHPLGSDLKPFLVPAFAMGIVGFKAWRGTVQYFLHALRELAPPAGDGRTHRCAIVEKVAAGRQ